MNARTARLGLIDRLRAQHRTIRRNLDRLEQLGRTLDGGRRVDPRTLERLRTFFQHFVQAEHESIEESLLFPALARRCPAPEIDALRRLEAEHLWSGALLRGLDPGEPSRTARLIRTFAPLVRLHIEREETKLFPLAERVLDADELASLGEKCAAVLAAASPAFATRIPARRLEDDPWCIDEDWQGETRPAEP